MTLYLIHEQELLTAFGDTKEDISNEDRNKYQSITKWIPNLVWDDGGDRSGSLLAAGKLNSSFTL